MREVSSAVVAAALAAQGMHVGWQSQYLRKRNWLQISLMGEIDEGALRRLPGALAHHMRNLLAGFLHDRSRAAVL